MCLVEFILIILSLISSFCLSFSISHVTNNYYFMFLMLTIVIFYYVWLLLYCVYVVMLSALFKKNDKYNRYFDHLLHNTDVILFHLLHIKVHATGLNKIPNDKYLIVGNHRSNFDPLALLRVTKAPMVAITKKETFKFPFVGLLIKACGYIPLNRENAREGAKSIFRARDLLKNDISSVMIFPEGTRNKTEEPLLPMHSGSFKPAFLTNKPIVVCSIKGTRGLKGKIIGKYSHIDVNVIDVLSPKDFNSTNEIAEKVEKMILEDLNR